MTITSKYKKQHLFHRPPLKCARVADVSSSSSQAEWYVNQSSVAVNIDSIAWCRLIRSINNLLATLWSFVITNIAMFRHYWVRCGFSLMLWLFFFCLGVPQGSVLGPSFCRSCVINWWVKYCFIVFNRIAEYYFSAIY